MDYHYDNCSCAKCLQGSGTVRRLACIACGRWIAGLDDYCTDCSTDSTLDDRERRRDLYCSLCPPNQAENSNRHGKHGKTKPKYKNKK